MTKPQFIQTESGEELVVLSRSEYDRLVTLDQEAAEDAEDAESILQSLAALARGDEIALPDATWTEIESGTHPIEAIRRYRGLTQTALAGEVGITQGFLSEIENRKKTGDVSVLKRIAAALKAPLDVIVE